MAATHAALELAMAGQENRLLPAPWTQLGGEALVEQFAELVKRLCRVMREERERLPCRDDVGNF